MNFQSWKFGSLDGRKQLHTTDCGVLALAITMKIARKKLYSIYWRLIIDLRHQIVSQCLSQTFPRSITKRIKAKFERIMMALRFNRQLSILQKHNMTRVLVSCVIASPVVFILLCNLDRHGRLLKVMKKVSYKYFRSLCSISSKLRGGPGTDHTVFGNNCQSILYRAETYEEF